MLRWCQCQRNLQVLRYSFKFSNAFFRPKLNNKIYLRIQQGLDLNEFNIQWLSFFLWVSLQFCIFHKHLWLHFFHRLWLGIQKSPPFGKEQTSNHSFHRGAEINHLFWCLDFEANFFCKFTCSAVISRKRKGLPDWSLCPSICCEKEQQFVICEELMKNEEKIPSEGF